MKNLLSLFIASAFSFSLVAQVTEDWISPEDDYSKSGIMVAVDASDNVFTLSDIFNGDIYISKRDVDGNILWSSGYDNTTASQWEVAGSVVIDINGDAIVTGYTNTGFGSDWYPVQAVTMKFNGDDGTLIWRVTFNTGSAYRGRKVLTDSEGNIYVGGDVNAFMIYHSEVGNMMVKKYDTNGNEIWSITENEFGSAMPGPLKTMKFDNAGNIIIAGYNASMAKITTDGIVSWSKTAVGGGITDIAIDASGNIYTLYSAVFGPLGGSSDFVVKKFSNSGTELSVNHYDFGSNEYPQQILCDNVGGAFITGYNSAGGYFNWITFRIDVDGDQLWSQVYDEHTGNDEIPKMMVKDVNDNIYIIGQGGPWPGYFWVSLTQMVTIKYSSDGAIEWTALYDLYANTGVALCLASDNSIYALAEMYAKTIHYTQVTPEVCTTPTGLFANNITTTKARLNWTLEPGAFQYEVWYKKSTASAWKKKIVPATSNKLNIKNLLCNTNYVWQIRTICDTTGTDFTSAFSTVQNFTTAACKEAENVMEHDIAGISLYPNPTTNSIFVEFQIGNNAVIKLMDLNGKVVEEFYYEGTLGDVIEIDVTNIPAGMYLVSIQMGMFHETQKVSIIR